MMMNGKTSLRLWAGLISCLIWATAPALADSPQVENDQQPITIIYTVQPGDTLFSIALRYNLSLTDILLANNLSETDFIFPGQRLTLPGVFLPSLPTIPKISSSSDQVHLVKSGETLFSIAELYHTSVNDIMSHNNITDPYFVQIGRILKVRSSLVLRSSQLDYPFTTISLSEPIVMQGRTLVVRIALAEAATVSGTFMEQPLFFYQNGPQQFWSLVAVHALLEPNVYPLTLIATLSDGRTITKTQEVQVIEGDYSTETIWLDNDRSGLLAPELVAQEQQMLAQIWSQVSPRPWWEGPFGYPVGSDSLRITSNFGTRRHYNGGSDLSFHGGADFGGGVGIPIYAPAAGRVVLAERLNVRGNAVLIDHGLGLYSGYWHQSQIAVSAGQEIQPGDLIGYIGDTGLVTGPHLHWEMRLNGVAVNPLQWVRESIP
jgi:murein DD-endopeptidase MepM/ murein hydrolase activator NlpD